ncbi:Ucr-2.2 [Aphelenchoides besseyi]|nr:Ucr-2.2 [Aphelenchoides besseyi]KAI6217277.1 Ucr-2.2 [Aphelenchoides besseyi]
MITTAIRQSSAVPIRNARLQCCSSSLIGSHFVHTSARRFTDSDPTPGDRPHMFMLEHVQKRIEYCIPLMFRRQLDFTFYRKDVVLDDEIFGMHRVGLRQYMTYMSTVSTATSMLMPYVDLQALNIIPMLDDGTVRLRWRVRYLAWSTWMNPRNFGKSAEEREKSFYWFDGYSIFLVDGTGLVSRVTLQKSQPNDEKEMGKTKKIVQKIAQIPNAANSSPTNRI